MSKCLLTDGRGVDSLRFSEKPISEELPAGQALVQVHSVSLNYRDLMVARGEYSGSYEPPIIVCTDFAGIVLKTAKDFKTLKADDKVINHPFRFWPAGKLNSNWIRTMIGGLGVDGVMTEQLIYPAEALVKMPAHMTFEEGSTLPIAGLTAWAAVVTHCQTRPGEWVLTHGTGGVSIFAAQIAKSIGARVILTSSRPEKAKVAKEKLKLDAIIDYKDENWPNQVKEITSGQGADVVIDTAGGEVLTRSILAAGYSSRIAIIGNIANRQTSFTLFDVVRRQISLRGIFMESCQELRAFAQACESTNLKPWIDKSFSFDYAVDAFRYLESQKHIGKIIVRLK